MRIQILAADSMLRPIGGLGEQLRQLIKAAAVNKSDLYFDVIGVGDDDEHTGDNFIYTPTKELILPVGQLSPMVKNLAGQVDVLARATKNRQRPDIVHAFDWTTYLAGIAAARYWEVPLVVTLQLSIGRMRDDGIAAQDDENLLRANEGVELAGMQHAAVVIQVSHAYANASPRFFDHKTIIVPNGIDLDEWSMPTPRVALPGDNPVKVIYIGRTDFMKNSHTLAELHVPDGIDLIFIGGTSGGVGTLIDKIQKRAREEPNVFWLGPKYGPDKIAHMRAAHAILFPSVHEPFGIVGLEAFAANTPLIASGVCGMTEYLREDNHLPCGTTAESIHAALENFRELYHHHPDRLDELRTAGRAMVARFPWTKIAGRLQRVYELVTNQVEKEP